MNGSNQNITAGSFLNKDNHEGLFPKQDLIYLLNGDISHYENSHNAVFVGNVLSNELCFKAPYNTQIFGAIQLDKDQYAVFVGDGAEHSEIILFDVNTCVQKSIVKSDCFKFTKPIRGVYKYHNDARHIYWTDGVNPVRYLDITNCHPKVRTNDCQDCQDNYTEEVDCEAMEFNKRINFPCITLKETTDGNLPNGVYQIAIAFSDNKQRFTDYFLYPDIIKLHSNTRQTFGIELNFKECFSGYYDEYELVLITHRIDRGTVAQRIGYFDTSQSDVYISDLDETFFTPIDNSVLLSQNVLYKSAGQIAVNSETLILGDLEEYPDFDYRASACEIDSEWVEMWVKKEDAHKYMSFMRDEVYPIDISFVRTNGQQTHKTHIPPKAPTTWTVEGTEYTKNSLVPNSIGLLPNFDYPEVLGDGCDLEPKKFWEIYNTAVITTTNVVNCNNCTEVEGNSGTFAYWESKDHLYPDDYPCGLACTPIKYHKFPDNCVSHIHDDKPCNDNCVKILTLRLKNVPVPIDCNGDEVATLGYVIHVGDRKNHKSILHKGLLFNTWNEPLHDNKIAQFSNYPFNDLGEDPFLGTEIRRQGFGGFPNLTSYNQDKFTYHSPDIHYLKGGQGTELHLYTEEVGKVSGEFHFTDAYPKYQLLSPIGRLAAQVAGVVEASLVLNGQPCTKSITTKVCKKVVERKTNVNNFPVSEITSQANAFFVNLTSAAGPVSGNVTGPITSISSMVTTHDYDYTSEADLDCTTTYSVSAISFEDYSSDFLGFPELDILNSDTCKIVITTNAPNGVSVSFTLNNNPYVGRTTDDSGIITIPLNGDCTQIIGTGPGGEIDRVTWVLGVNIQASDFKFNPPCDCTGDQEFISTTETETCEPKIKSVNAYKWFERIPALMYYYSEGINAVQNFLRSTIKPTNYAVQATFLADYSGYNCTNIKLGNKRRLIEHSQYLLPIKQFVESERFNNWSREYSEYLRLSGDILDPSETDNTKITYSTVFCNGSFDFWDKQAKSFDFCTNDQGGDRIQAVSYYGGVKRYKPNQYGTLTNYQSRTVSCIQDNWATSEVIYGGDVYITQFSLTRKMPIFDNLPLGLPNNTEFNVLDYTNIAQPHYWLDYSTESAIEDAVENIPVIGNLFYDYNLEDILTLGQCGIDLDFEILGAAGYLPAWLINIGAGNFTNPFKQHGIFYTHITGVVNYWVESEFINDFREYNELPKSEYYPLQEPKALAKATEYEIPEQFLYNLQYHNLGLHKQLISKPRIDCCDTSQDDNRIIYSLTTSEESVADNWLNFRPNSYQVLDPNVGSFTGIKEIDDYNLLLVFEDAVFVTQQDDALVTESGDRIFLGSNSIFSRRMRKLTTECTGYGGCIDLDSIVSTRYGVFWFDRKRKKVFKYAGNQLADVTGNFQSWFNRYMNGKVIGVFDNFTDNLYFTDVETGWTLSYKPKADRWISHHSFVPDNYFCAANTFLSSKDSGIWKHNKQYNYQTYYGINYPFEVGVLVNNEFKSTVLQSLEIYSEWIEYKDYDCKIYHKDEFFDKILIFNNFTSTNLQNVHLKDPNNVRHDLPNIITASYVEDMFRINGFSNQNITQPFYSLDDNGCTYKLPAIEKLVKETNEIRGRWFRIHLRRTNNDKYKILMQLQLNIQDEIVR
jgi:hypothetical protein